MKIFLHKNLLFFLVILLISACSSDDAVLDSNLPPEVASEEKAEEIYNRSMDALLEKRYKTAIEGFQEIERQYPFSPWATKSQVRVAFAHYEDQEYDDAVDVIDRFTKLNPGNKDVPYMYYLKALSYYERISDVRRDQKITQQAQTALNNVLVRFPTSQYAKDARLKLDLVRDHLAGKEMEIGRFYQQRQRYIAAINRFKEVVEKFETTNHVPEALYRLTETYLSLGVMPEAKKYAAVLGHNFPKTKWYKFAYDLVENGKNSPGIKQKPAWYEDFLFEQEEDVNCGENCSFLGGVGEFFNFVD